MRDPRALLAVAIVIVASQSQVVLGQCELNANCATCIAAATAGCGWCASDQQCHTGATQGPQNGSCAAWFWQRCPSCSNQYGCPQCLHTAGCGYCTTPGLGIGSFCLEGNATAPYSHLWNCSTWNYGAQSTCPTPAPPSPPPALSCSQWSGPGNCGSCVEVSGCGWCASTEQCLVAGSGGPLSGTCSAWYLSCPYCSNLGTCTTCLNDYNCGWCATAPGTVKCFNGNSLDPYRGHCDSWYFGQQHCPAPTNSPMTPSPPNCADYNGCAYCLEWTGCGWCSATQQCMAGGISGPSSGSCPAWVPTGGQCPSCSSKYSCEYCRVDSLCGWCGTSSSGYCYDGNATGPFTTTCQQGEWIHFPRTCGTMAPPTPVPFATCAALTTCTLCSGNSNCGWCEGTQSCVPGSYSGPTSGSCATWRFGSCPDCSDYFTCATCTASSTGLCGWCTSSNTCVAGNSSGPFNPGAFCSNWTAPGGSCFYDPCTQYHHCPDCLSTPQQTCGWCMTSGTCRSGATNGPNSGSCPNWWYEVCPSGYCHQNTDCASCVASPAGDCGWCTTNKLCSSGTSTGPNSGVCTGAWEWYSAQCLDSAASPAAAHPESAKKTLSVHQPKHHSKRPDRLLEPQVGR